MPVETWSDPVGELGRGRKVDTPFRLLGHYHDEETGLFATRFRAFDPETGRWLSPDPLGIDGGTNLYAFDGCPTADVDPFGLSTSEGSPHGATTTGTLTEQEQRELQALADRYNTRIDVIGSRAEGRGRNIDTNLPVGKGPGTRSDIDCRIDGQVDVDTRGALSDGVRAVGNGAGSVASSTGLPSRPPVIIFRPGQPPEHVR